MRKFFEKAIATVVASAMVASVITVVEPTAVKAADVKLGTWTITTAGNVPDNWGDYGDLSQLNYINFSDGTSLVGSQIATMTWDGKGTVGGLTTTNSSADGFETYIQSNGWQAQYTPIESMNANNPWTIHIDMKDIQLDAGYKYELSFDAFSNPEDYSDPNGGATVHYDCKYANIVVVDADTNVYASQTIAITPETNTFKFDVDVINNPNVTVQIFLGAFPIVKDPVTKAEVNWRGKVNVSGLKFVNKGKSDKVATVSIVNNGKTKTSLVTKGEALDKPNAGTKAGYTFDGWYVGKSKYNFDNPVDKDLTIVAKWTKVVKPAKAKLTSVKSKKAKQITVVTKKIKGVKGYKIMYSTNKKFKKAKTVTSKTATKVIKKLKSGTKVYVKVKAFRVDSKGKKYEAKKWSNVKSTYVR